MNIYKHLLASIFALSFLVIGLFTQKDYGINWDQPLRMLRGQAYTHFFLTRHKIFWVYFLKSSDE